jgi:hypothetical protein
MSSKKRAATAERSEPIRPFPQISESLTPDYSIAFQERAISKRSPKREKPKGIPKINRDD